jgi:hypothetical protein
LDCRIVFNIGSSDSKKWHSHGRNLCFCFYEGVERNQKQSSVVKECAIACLEKHCEERTRGELKKSLSILDSKMYNLTLHMALAAWRSGHHIRLRNKKTRVRIPPGYKDVKVT